MYIYIYIYIPPPPRWGQGTQLLNLWDSSSLTRAQTWVLGSESGKSQPLDLQWIPRRKIFYSDLWNASVKATEGKADWNSGCFFHFWLCHEFVFYCWKFGWKKRTNWQTDALLFVVLLQIRVQLILFCAVFSKNDKKVWYIIIVCMCYQIYFWQMRVSFWLGVNENWIFHLNFPPCQLFVEVNQIICAIEIPYKIC